MERPRKKPSKTVRRRSNVGDRTTSHQKNREAIMHARLGSTNGKESHIPQASSKKQPRLAIHDEIKSQPSVEMNPVRANEEVVVFNHEQNLRQQHTVSLGESLAFLPMVDGETIGDIVGEVTPHDRVIVNNVLMAEAGRNEVYDEALRRVVAENPERIYDLINEAWKRTSLTEMSTEQLPASLPENEA